MNISIWDLDFYYKKTIMPNINCMRLSSYHKQKGDKINFISQETHLDLVFDILYINRELDVTPLPSRKYIDDKRTQLIGNGFRYFGAKELNSIVTACRPDYLLYTIEKTNQYTNANFITFYAGNKLIKSRQDWHNTKANHKKTIVTDKHFWKAEEQDILYCLEVLKDEKNIAFLEPISLSKILNNKNIREKFLELHFSTGTKFKWKNDYSSNYPEVLNIISFLKELQKKTRSDLGFIPIKAITIKHTNEEEFNLDFLRCIQIVAEFKTAKIKCAIIAPKEVLSSPYYKFFYMLEVWTRYYIKLSYVEFILHDMCAQEGVLWYNILNNPIKWKNVYIDYLLYMLVDNDWDNYKQLLFVQWGIEELNSNKINYNIIKQNITLIYKDLQ